MKTRLIALISVPVLLTAATLSFAEKPFEGKRCDSDRKGMMEHRGEGRHGMDAEKRLEMLSRKLDLSDSQKAELKTAFAERESAHQTHRDEMRSLHEQLRTLDPAAADYANKVADLKQKASTLAGEKIDMKLAMQSDLDRVLTAEQKQTFAQMKERMEKRYHE